MDLNQQIKQKIVLDKIILEVKGLDFKKEKLLRKAKPILKNLMLDQKIKQVKIKRKGLKLKLVGKKGKVPRHACQEPKKSL